MQLQSALQSNFRMRVGRKYGRNLARFAARATAAVEAGSTGIAVFAGAPPPAAGLLGKIFGGLSGFLGRRFGVDSNQEVTNALRSDLTKIDGQLLVIIDDIDRLHPNEMRQLLTLVKTYGDLPRVTHLLLYDKEIVDDALASEMNRRQAGPSYLEKIVQLSTSLPAVPHWRLLDLLRDQLKIANVEFDDARLTDVWRRGLRDFLDAPRDVIRLTNALNVGWPAISDHADLLDFLCLEAIRLTEQEVWKLIRNLRYELVGRSDRSISSGSMNITSIAANGGQEHQQSLLFLIEMLFPMLSGNSKAYIDRAQLRRRRAVGAPEYVDVYFLLQPGEALGGSEIGEFIDALKDEDRIRALLLGVERDRERLRSVLNGLSDALASTEFDTSILLKVLIDVGDDLINRPSAVPPTAFDSDVFDDLDRLVWECFTKVSTDFRERAVIEAIQASRSISIPAIAWQRIALRAHLLPGINQSGEPELHLPTASAVTKVGVALHSHLQQAFERRDNRFHQAPLLGWVLKIWADTGALSSASAAARELINQDVSLIQILDSLMGTSVSSEGSRRTLRDAPIIPGVSVLDLVQRVRSRVHDDDFLSEVSTEDLVVYRSIAETFLLLIDDTGGRYFEVPPWEQRPS